jgi:predicted esterase
MVLVGALIRPCAGHRAPVADRGPGDAPVHQTPDPPEAGTARFQVQNLTARPFQAVQLWAPPPGSPGSYQTVILLHGNQPGASDPTWMIGLRWQPQFAHRILLVPAIPDGGYEFGAPTARRALARLVDDVARSYPVDRDAIYLVGYSAGASRVLSVASQVTHLRGIVAVAGDIARPIRDTKRPLEALRSVPILLACMTDDTGPHTNCRLNEENRALLERRGLRKVEMRYLPGSHQLDVEQLAPALDQWMTRH